MQVTAEEKSMQSKKELVITAKTHRLSTEQIHRMSQVVEIFLDKVKAVQRHTDARHQLES